MELSDPSSSRFNLKFKPNSELVLLNSELFLTTMAPPPLPSVPGRHFPALLPPPPPHGQGAVAELIRVKGWLFTSSGSFFIFYFLFFPSTRSCGAALKGNCVCVCVSGDGLFWQGGEMWKERNGSAQGAGAESPAGSEPQILPIPL